MIIPPMDDHPARVIIHGGSEHPWRANPERRAETLPAFSPPGKVIPVIIEGHQLGEVAVDDILPPLPAEPMAEGNGA
jgi:hypothetical protein